MPNKKITELATAGALTGIELVEIVQGGANVKTTTQDIADLGGGGGSGWGTSTDPSGTLTAPWTIDGAQTVDFGSVTPITRFQVNTPNLILQSADPVSLVTVESFGAVNLTSTNDNVSITANGSINLVSGSLLINSSAGIATQVLTSNGPGVPPTWQTPASGGDFVGPASSIDNGIVSFDGTTGKLGKSTAARLILNGTNGVKGHYLGYNSGNTTTITVADGQNTGFGYEALNAITDGANFFNASYNTGFGYQALKALTTGRYTTSFGYWAGKSATAPISSVFIGSRSGAFITNQTDNTFIGDNTGAGVSNTGTFNFFGGSSAGSVNTTGGYNVFVGGYAGLSNTTGDFNVYVGAEAAETNNTGDYNVAIGHWALLYATASGTNTVVGGDSFGGTLTNPYTVNGMVGLGYRSGVTETAANATVSGNGDTFIGTESGAGSTTQISYATGIGYRAHPLLDYEFALGSYSSTYKPNWGFGGSGFGSGRGVIFVKDADTAPTGDPTSGFWLYSRDGNEIHKSPQASFIGDYTGASDVTPLHAFTINKNVTQVGSATNKVASIARITGTITGAGGGGTQELNALLIDPTFNTSAGSRNFYIHAKSSTGGSAFQVREETEDSRNTIMKVLGGTSSATELFMQVQTNATYISTTGPSMNYTNSSSSTAAFHNFSINNVTLGGFSNQATNVAGRGFNIAPIVATASTSTATQTGSSGLFVTGNFWTGATNVGPVGFYQALVASTSVNRLGYWRLRENISAVDPGDIISVKGGADFGLGIGVSDPTARLHLMAGTATANQGPLKFTSGTNLATAENGVMEYNGTNLFFTRAGAVRENIICESSVNAVSPTAPNRTITINIDGSTYYLHAKTTND